MNSSKVPSNLMPMKAEFSMAFHPKAKCKREIGDWGDEGAEEQRSRGAGEAWGHGDKVTKVAIQTIHKTANL
ncbi:hypothetical protein [Nostoc sp. 'Lobaria pulmonaria (5183) cyanobiont']|uniref:hypothetical protein n=1 Tax=Nostoc sp. 'Lobaria pulmonaria (5183) cyanobiont' TaxID=1618022 RepID=UPI001319EEA3|nr:hypothetical protein [Nostoc sp. 'Lobaria pulmonaria (5183) cyanobiont']